MWEEMPFSSRRMGSGRRKVIWALCFLLLLLEAGSAKNLWKRALHPRLAEKPRVSAGEREAGRRSPQTRAGQHLYLSVPGSGGGQMNSPPSQGSLSVGKAAEGHPKNVQGDCDMPLATTVYFLLTGSTRLKTPGT